MTEKLFLASYCRYRTGSLRFFHLVLLLGVSGVLFWIGPTQPRSLVSAFTSLTGFGSTVLAAQGACTPGLATISAASFRATDIAPNSIVSSFGSKLATQTRSAPTGAALPTTLGGTTVKVNTRSAGIFFVSATQVNFLLPPETEVGNATVEIRAGDGACSTGTIQVRELAPAIFTANADGRDAPAALLLRVKRDNSQVFESITRFNSATNRIEPKPIDLGPEGERVFLVLYLTGLFNYQRARPNLRLLIGESVIIPDFVGAAPGLFGLSQVNAEIPRTLTERGRVNLSLTGISGFASNVVQIDIAPQTLGIRPSVTGFGSANALAGQLLQINGTGFAANATDNKVLINDLEAKIVADQSTTTRLTVRVPFGVETGKVYVRTAQGEGVSANTISVRTSLSGFVETTDRQPIRGVAIKVQDPRGVFFNTTTSADGSFSVPDLAVGLAEIEADSSALRLTLPYPIFKTKKLVAANKDNLLAAPITLQSQTGATVTLGTQGTSLADKTAVPAAVAVTLQNGGVIFEVADNAVISFPGGGGNGTLSLTVVERSRVPVELPPGQFSSRIVQITPFGATITPGGKLTFPNADGFTANAPVKLWRYDRTLGSFAEAGNLTVSSDGQKIETAANAITETSYYFVSASQPTTAILGRVVEPKVENGQVMQGQFKPVPKSQVQARGQGSFTDVNGAFLPTEVAVKQGNNSISVEAGYIRPTGRVDRALQAVADNTAVINGTTRVGNDLILPSEIINRPPVFNAPDLLSVFEGESRNVDIIVRDPDEGLQNIQINLTLVVLGQTGNPSAAFARLEPQDPGKGEYRLVLAPGNNDLGVYTLLLTATDNTGGGQAQKNITVRVDRPVQVMVETNPLGRSFKVDGVTYAAKQAFIWAQGSTHTIGTVSPQSGSSGTQFVWTNWSDSEAVEHTVTANTPRTYTANFKTQHFLTMAANPPTAGMVTPPPQGNWFDSGQTVTITATPNGGFRFSNWAGSGAGAYSGSNNPATVTVNGPLSQTANFEALPPPGAFTLSSEPAVCDPTAPSEPAVRLNWTAATNAASYEILLGATLVESSITGNSFYVKGGMAAGQNYNYVVRARNSSGTRDSNTLPVSIAASLCGNAPVTVSLPMANGTRNTDVTIPITVGDLSGRGGALGVIAFEFEFTFDPSVLQILNPVTDATGSLSSTLHLTTNEVAPGRLRVAGFGPNELTGVNRTLLNLKFKVIGPVGSSTAITWQKFQFNEGDPPVSTAHGRLTVN